MTTKFYGQERILSELSLLIPEINAGRNFNLLFAGKSGYGKTTLALRLCTSFSTYSMGGPPNFRYSSRAQICFLDEIHELEEIERLYSIMDSGRQSFIFATNELGLLKEPFINRCIAFIFSDYTDDEMQEMIEDRLSTFNLETEILDIIRVVGFNNPRVTLGICRRLEYIFRNYGTPTTREEILAILINILGLDESGLNAMDRQYLEFLQSHSRLSLDALCSLLHVSRDTLKREVEPKLLYRNLIKITSRGRELY